MKSCFLSIYVILFLILVSCSEKENHKINLRWTKAYPEDSFKKSYTGLKWALSYLGSNIASDTLLNGISFKDSIITLNVKALGFSENASKNLSELHRTFKNSEEYNKFNALDLGRYVSLIFGNPYNYYAIVDVPKSLEQFEQFYALDSAKGYIDNSSISKVDRIISYSNPSENNSQGFISAEIDSISKAILEYETMEIMPNGQLRFGIYDINGELKNVANKNITKAGKPAKCIWCHEVNVQQLFRPQQDHYSYLSYIKFNDTLKYFNQKLQSYQDSSWKDKNIKNKMQHTELELLYIAFMEPNAERIAKEWNIPVNEVKHKLSHLKTHVYEEFPFLGDLYHRKDIDLLTPYKIVEAPESIRE